MVYWGVCGSERGGHAVRWRPRAPEILLVVKKGPARTQQNLHKSKSFYYTLVANNKRVNLTKEHLACILSNYKNMYFRYWLMCVPIIEHNSFPELLKFRYIYSLNETGRIFSIICYKFFFYKFNLTFVTQPCDWMSSKISNFDESSDLALLNILNSQLILKF